MQTHNARTYMQSRGSYTVHMYLTVPALYHLIMAFYLPFFNLLPEQRKCFIGKFHHYQFISWKLWNSSISNNLYYTVVNGLVEMLKEHQMKSTSFVEIITNDMLTLKFHKNMDLTHNTYCTVFQLRGLSAENNSCKIFIIKGMQNQTLSYHLTYVCT